MYPSERRQCQKSDVPEALTNPISFVEWYFSRGHKSFLRVLPKTVSSYLMFKKYAAVLQTYIKQNIYVMCTSISWKLICVSAYVKNFLMLLNDYSNSGLYEDYEGLIILSVGGKWCLSVTRK